MKPRRAPLFLLARIFSGVLFALASFLSAADSGVSPLAPTPRNDAAGPAPPRLELSPGPYYVGATLTATIIVPGGTSRPVIDLSPVREFEAALFDTAPLPASGGETGYVVRLSLLPKRPGTLPIPALNIRGPGGPRRTEAIAIAVKEPQSAADMSLAASVSEARCYVGQPLTLEIAWTFAARISSIHAVDLRVPLLEHADFKSRDFSSVPKQFGSPIGLPVGNTRVIGGASGRTIRLRKIIIPQKVGAVALPGATLLCSVMANAPDSRTGFAYAPQYDNQFFADADKAGAERLYVRSEPMKIVVLPLPAEGRPANFSGIVGEFSLLAAIDPASAREGEPVTLTLRARGYAYPEVLDLPTLGQMPGFRGRFRIPADRAMATLEMTERGAEKVFRQSIRPVSSGVDQVPAVEIPFFDPASATYHVARTPAMPLLVRPNSAATAFDAVLSDGSRLKNLLVPREPAIGPNFTAAELLRTDLGREQASAIGWVAFGLPPLLYIVFMAITRRGRFRRFDPIRERVLWAYADFRRATRGEDDPAVLRRALHTYLSHRLNIGVVTHGAVEARLRELGVHEETLAMLRSFFQQGDRQEFSEDPPGTTIGLTNHSAHAIAEAIEAALGNTKAWIAGPPLRVAVMVGLFCAAFPDIVASPSSVAITEAENFFQTGTTQRFEEPEAALDAFRKAAAGFEYLVNTAPSEFDGGRLHYNAGAARFFAGDFGAAVYHFRMAELAAPRDARIRAALGYVRVRQPDAASSGPARKSWDDFVSGKKVFGGRLAGIALGAMWALFWVLACLAAYRPSPKLKKFSTVLLVGSAALGILLVVDAIRFRARPEGVVLAPEIVTRQGPAAIYEPAFESAIHAGAEFRVIGQSNDWLQVRFRGLARPCWIPANSAVVLGREPPTRRSANTSDYTSVP